ncbi:MAG: slipin family protein [Pseudanabaenaceae cyanobacterium SKYGB_i_bin29]|nr:slipin family protein [Pseudanabaenaceae cyanobacterium SKYG29]MDW8420576.1 slipin family protein [Pseudanabaenaceae cyanobacterium SKYGB_i_bin29]
MEGKEELKPEDRDISKVYATPGVEHIFLGGPIRNILFWIPTLILFLILGGTNPAQWGKRVPHLVGAVIASTIWGQIVRGVRVAAEWEKAVILTLGKFSEIRGSGIFYVVPVIESVRFVDTRVQVINIPKQRAITRDNVPVVVDSALFLVVKNAGLAVTKVQNYRFATAQYAQAALRDVVGASTLDELLSEREKVQEQIASIVGEKVRNWGIDIDSVQLQDFDLPEELKKVMARQASAEREKRATITKAEGDRLAAQNLAEAAQLMRDNPIALELRTLQTIDGLASSPSNTVILFPMELGSVLKSLQTNQLSSSDK